MSTVMVYGIVSNHHSPVLSNRFTRIGVDVKARKVAAGNIQAYSMSLLEQVTGRIEDDGEKVDIPRLHHLCLFA